MSGAEVFDKYNSAVFIVHADDGKDQTWQGSGFFINPDGVAMTNLHVLAGAYLDDVEMKDGLGRKYGLKEVLWYDEQLDAAIIQVATSGKTNYIPRSKREKHVGDKVYALGSPLGLSNTFSSGEISQFRPRKSGGSYYRIQISAPIDHGSSGGALINEYGEAIGITSAGRDDSGANLNFAVDLDDVWRKMGE